MLTKVGLSLLLVIHGFCSEESHPVNSGQNGVNETQSSNQQGNDGQNGNIFVMNYTATGIAQDTSSIGSPTGSTSQAPSTSTPTEKPETQPKPNPDDFSKSDIGQFRQRLRLFAGELYHQILQMTPKDKNIFFSPTSISHALATINAGAKGQSSLQIREAMKIADIPEHYIDILFKLVTDDKFSVKEKSNVIAKLAAQCFIERNFTVKESYTDTLKQYYSSGVEKIDFSQESAAKTRINNWVEDNTNKLIKDLLPDGVITPLTRMVMVNVLYFKATWSSKFLPWRTDKFYTPSGPVDVPYIFKKDYFRYKEIDDVVYIGVPYNDGETFFFIMMPKTDNALEKFERKSNIKTCFRYLRKKLLREWEGETKVTVILPEFTTEQNVDLVAVLRGIGVTDIFSETKADLSGIVDKTYLYISDFLHKARIAVNEDGTEAAAASAAIASGRSLSSTFVINRPFIFGVFEVDGDMLFAGKVVNPNA